MSTAHVGGLRLGGHVVELRVRHHLRLHRLLRRSAVVVDVVLGHELLLLHHLHVVQMHVRLDIVDMVLVRNAAAGRVVPTILLLLSQLAVLLRWPDVAVDRLRSWLLNRFRCSIGVLI